jgi:DNA-binding Xre family transcriptional regulator
VIFSGISLLPIADARGNTDGMLIPSGSRVNAKIPLVGQPPEQTGVVAHRLAKQLGAFLRKKRGDLTYLQFSRKMGISDSTLHRLELGEQNVTLRTLEQICDRLKCGVSDVFGDE